MHDSDLVNCPELSIVVPTFNEKENIEELVKRLEKKLKGINWEVIFVDDDSPDGTANFAKQLSLKNPKVRCIHRIGRRGLSTACIEGAMPCISPYIAVMDADLQHDENILSQMLETIKNDEVDIVVGSRYIEEGGLKKLSEIRKAISYFATTLGKKLLGVKLSDPMSGYFIIKRDVFEQVVRSLSGVGFKILLDIFASSKKTLKFKEVPYKFRGRFKGESKLDSHVALDFLMLLGDKFFGGFFPVRFLSFSIIGSIGLLVHMLILTLFFKGFSFSFIYSQTLAALLTIGANFSLNNVFTYFDRRLKGLKLVKGLISFYLVCGLGAIANIAVSTYLFQ